MNNILKGRKGEDIAVRYLKDKGYKILRRNYRTRFGEIDIIAKRKKKLIFVEVKYGNSKYHFPYERVGRSKILRLMRTISVYLLENPTEDSLQVDVLSVDENGDVLHFEDVVEIDLL